MCGTGTSGVPIGTRTANQTGKHRRVQSRSGKVCAQLTNVAVKLAIEQSKYIWHKKQKAARLLQGTREDKAAQPMIQQNARFLIVAHTEINLKFLHLFSILQMRAQVCVLVFARR